MNNFLNFVDELVKRYPLHIEIYYSKTMDWVISVYKKGCAKDGSDLRIVCVQSCDLDYALAKAEVQLKDWMLKNEGGY